jgi:hypothetical protein
LLRAFVKFFVTRIGYGNATLVMLGELQEASLDERICLIRKRTDQFGLLVAKASVHLYIPEISWIGGVYARRPRVEVVGTTVS